MMGGLSILNVGEGDTKLSFDKSNPAERIRAARIVTDMLRRGYALLVEVEQDGEKRFQRVKKFDEEKCEYIIADFDPTVAEEDDEREITAAGEPGTVETAGEPAEQPSAPASRPRGRPRRTIKRSVPASSTRAVAVARSAGG